MPKRTGNQEPAGPEELERMFKALRRKALEVRRRMETDFDWGSKLRDLGVYEVAAQMFQDGKLLVEVQKCLKQDHGVHVALSTLCQMRQRILGKAVTKVFLEQVERTEAMLDPLLNLGQLLRRVENRYEQHIETEKMVGVPIPDAAHQLLKLMLEVSREIAAVLKLLGYVKEVPVKVEARVDVHDRAIEEVDPQRLGTLLALALASEKRGDDAGRGGAQ